MKLFAMISAFALLTVSAAQADDTKTLGGCALIDKGGYFVKADATCAYAFADDGQEDRDLVDTDGVASTPRERVGN